MLTNALRALLAGMLAVALVLSVASLYGEDVAPAVYEMAVDSMATGPPVVTFISGARQEYMTTELRERGGHLMTTSHRAPIAHLLCHLRDHRLRLPSPT